MPHFDAKDVNSLEACEKKQNQSKKHDNCNQFHLILLRKLDRINTRWLTVISICSLMVLYYVQSRSGRVCLGVEKTEEDAAVE